MRNRTGNPPIEGRLIVQDDAWALYALSASKSADWLNTKLVARVRTPGRANYWLCWNRAEQRFGGLTRRDADALREQHPVVFAWVKFYCKHYDIA